MLRRLLTIAVASFMLAGCLKPIASTLTRPDQTVTALSAAHLHGQIGTMKGYHVQLTDLLEDFAKGATVSLIEVSTGNTVGTSIADASGSFVIKFGASFTAKRANPTDARSIGYYLEAVKGLQGGNSAPNQAGADAMRLRTLIWYDFANNGWISLGNQTPGPINVSIGTTSVAFYINQQLVNAQAVTPEAYIGSLNTLVDPPAYLGAGAGVLAGTGVRNLAADMYSDLFTQITNAVAKDQDPLHSIVLSPSGGAVNTQTSFTFAGMSPLAGSIGTTVTIAGTGFEPGNMTVNFVGAAATINVGSSNATTLVVNVPAGARSGLIQLTLNGVNTYSTPFSVTSHDGHLVYFTDAGGNTTLYSVTNSLGTLVRVNPNGSTYTLSTALSSPRGVLVNPEGATSAPYKIYVANGDNRVVQMDSTGAMLDASWLAVTDPYALSLGPDGDLYVAQRSSNQITRFDVNWAAGTLTGTVATYTGFSAPSALAFDPSGYLYAVETAQGRVVRFRPQAGDTGSVALSPVVYPTAPTAPHNCEVWAYVPDPQGIAIDTAGNSFVTSQSNNVVMRVDPVGNLTSFAGVSGARSIARDAAGNLYVSEQTRNLIRRITLAGDQRIHAFGLSGLRGLAVDGSNNLYVSLSNVGAILKVDSDLKTTSSLISGIAPPSGLTFRNGKLYIAHNDDGTPNKPCCGGNNGPSVSEVELSGAARSVLTSGIYWPGAAEVSDDGATYYVGRVYGTYGAWPDSMWWYNTWDNAGINVVNPGAGTNVHRRPVVPQFSADGYWNTLAQSIERVDVDRWLYTSSVRKKLVMSVRLNGRDGTNEWRDITPPGFTNKVFPNDIYDVVYDGSQYAYVACRDGNIYRIDLNNVTGVPGTISVPGGYPFGMTMVGGTLYATDPGANKIHAIASPATATTVTSSTAAAAVAQPRGITNYGGTLYVTDYTNRQIMAVTPGTWAVATHITGLAGSPTRVRAFNDGRLLVRVSDGVIYQISTGTPAATAYRSTIGCTGCDSYEFYIDASNGVHWGYPMRCWQRGNDGLLHTHSVIRDGDWLYMGATNAMYAMNLNTGNDLVINGIGNVFGVAVDPDTRMLFTGSTGGEIYGIDGTTRVISNGPDLNQAIWGMAYNNGNDRLYVAANGNNSLYEVNPSGWTQSQLKVGLNSPMF